MHRQWWWSPVLQDICPSFCPSFSPSLSSPLAEPSQLSWGSRFLLSVRLQLSDLCLGQSCLESVCKIGKPLSSEPSTTAQDFEPQNLCEFGQAVIPLSLLFSKLGEDSTHRILVKIKVMLCESFTCTVLLLPSSLITTGCFPDIVEEIVLHNCFTPGGTYECEATLSEIHIL